MGKVEVIKNCTEFVTRERNAQDSWDRGDTSTDWTIHGIKSSRASYDLIVPFDVKFGKRYHLLYAIYSTGDSFGHNERACFEAIGVYEDTAESLAMAFENKRRIEGHYYVYGRSAQFLPDPPSVEDYPEQFSITLLNSKGEEFKMHVPWCGYFESLEELEIKEVVCQ
jgi:hypothetical protein